MKVSAPHRGWTSGRATPSLRPNPYAAETANPAGRHLSFAEICPDDRGRLCWRAASSDQDDYPSGADRNQRLAILLCNRFIEKSASIHHPIQVTAERKRRIRRMVNRIPLEIVLLGSRRTPLHRTKALSSSESTVAIRCSTIRAFSGQSSAPGAGRRISRQARRNSSLPGNGRQSRRASTGPYTRISTCRGPSLQSANAKQRRQVPRTWNMVTSTVLGTTKTQQFRILCWRRAPFRLSRTHAPGFDPSSLSDQVVPHFGYRGEWPVPAPLALRFSRACASGIREQASIYSCPSRSGAAPPSSGGGEDEHSLQIPGHRHQTPLAAHFLQPAQ